MKQTIFILTLTLGFWSCTSKNNSLDGKSIDTLSLDVQRNNENALLLSKEHANNTENEASKDSAFLFSDSLFTSLEFEMQEISKSAFQDYEKKYKLSCPLDSNGFIKGSGLILSHYCNEICESYLLDKKEGVKLVLPSDYDAGIMGLLFSPSCNQFIVYSSYDGPDYADYYDHRAEIIGFNVVRGVGLKTIEPSFKYQTKDWSIENITWIDDNNLALKLYNGERSGNVKNIKCNYFKTNLEAK